MGKPAARLTDLHACPIPGHLVGPIVTGCYTVLTCSLPQARMSDVGHCGATMFMGSMTVLVGSSPAARLGDVSAHGSVITGPCALTVLIG